MDYIAPDACYQFRSQGITESYLFECSSDRQYITEKLYPSPACNVSNFIVKAIFHKDDGYAFNCDGDDCSSVIRFYDSCDLNDDFDSNAIVMGVCGTYGNISQIVKCNNSSQIDYTYERPYCQGTAKEKEYKNGCHLGIYYIQIQSCHDGVN